MTVWTIFGAKTPVGFDGRTALSSVGHNLLRIYNKGYINKSF